MLQLLLVLPGWKFLVLPLCGASLIEYLLQFATPLLCALLAGTIAWLAAHTPPHGMLRLAVGTTVGGSVYLGSSWFLNRTWVLAMLQLLRFRPLARNRVD